MRRETKKRNYESVALFFPEINVDEAEFDGITDQINGAVKFQFAHNAGAVVFNGFGADEKSFTDFIGGKPFSDHDHYLLLPAGQCVVGSICTLHLVRLDARELFNHLLRNGSVHEIVALKDGTNPLPAAHSLIT